jgi:DNA-binding transcriptional regulator YdaS (Cro superfamily)
MAAGTAPISAEMAVQIETGTDGLVTRRDTFKDKWQKIWPELAAEQQ